MGLRLKFNLVLSIVFVFGLAVTAYISWGLLQRNARDEDHVYAERRGAHPLPPRGREAGPPGL